MYPNEEVITPEMYDARTKCWGYYASTVAALLTWPNALKGSMEMILQPDAKIESIADAVNVIGPVAGTAVVATAAVAVAAYYIGKVGYKSLVPEPTPSP